MDRGNSEFDHHFAAPLATNNQQLATGNWQLLYSSVFIGSHLWLILPPSNSNQKLRALRAFAVSKSIVI
jgi:hypothetical protein